MTHLGPSNLAFPWQLHFERHAFRKFSFLVFLIRKKINKVMWRCTVRLRKSIFIFLFQWTANGRSGRIILNVTQHAEVEGKSGLVLATARRLPMVESLALDMIWKPANVTLKIAQVCWQCISQQYFSFHPLTSLRSKSTFYEELYQLSFTLYIALLRALKTNEKIWPKGLLEKGSLKEKKERTFWYSTKQKCDENKYYIIYHIISYHIISYHIISHHIIIIITLYLYNIIYIIIIIIII